MQKPLAAVLLAIGGLAALSWGYYSCQNREAPEEPAEPKLAVESFELPNGLKAELVSGDCGDDVALVASFAFGAAHDPPGQSGMAELVREIAGGKLETHADHSVYSLVTKRDRLLAELDALAALMKQPKLGQAELDAARKRVLAGIARQSGGDPRLTAMTYAAESIRPSRGNGRRGGIAEEVESVDLDALQAFWKAAFAPRGARIVVVGSIEAANVQPHIQETFGKIANAERAKLRPPGESTVIGTLVMGDAPSAVAMAVPVPAASEATYPAFLVLASRLLSQASKARGWAVTFDPVAGPETLFVTGPVKPNEGAEPAAARIRKDVVDSVSRPLSSEDVALVRERFGPYLGEDELDPRSCKSDPRALAKARARRATVELGKVELGKAIASVDEGSRAAAAELFGPKRATAVIAGGEIR